MELWLGTGNFALAITHLRTTDYELLQKKVDIVQTRSSAMTFPSETVRELTDAPDARVLPAGGKIERLISLPGCAWRNIESVI